MPFRLLMLAALAATLLGSSPALAQAYQCAVPDKLPGGASPLAGDKRFARRIPTTGYSLSISWSPQYCKQYGRQAGSSFQCASGNRFGFVLHGLWPDGAGKSWPQYCRPVPRVSPAQVRSQLCMTPSPDLIQHEWAKHGSCMNLSGPAEYFAKSNALYSRLRYPDMNRLSRRRGLTVGQFKTEFARANPGISPTMVRVATRRDGWLDEVRLCLDTRLKYRACRGSGGTAADYQPLKIWRGRR